MPSLPAFQSFLFYSAAFANFAIIPKHLAVGATKIPKAIQTIPDGHFLAKNIVRTPWDMANGSLIVIGLLNYKWAKYGAPALMEEKLMLGASTLSALYIGATYYKVGMYLPLVTLWLAPTATVIAWFPIGNLFRNLGEIHLICLEGIRSGYTVAEDIYFPCGPENVYFVDPEDMGGMMMNSVDLDDMVVREYEELGEPGEQG